MKYVIVVLVFTLYTCVLPVQTQAQLGIGEVIKEGVTKVIKAVDLKVQRLQNKTIWLQNAQKVIENSMSQMHLDGIADWVQKQKDLYSDYYIGLSKVKSVITCYHQIKDISELQVRLVKEYKNAWNTIQHDSHFTAGELTYMSQVYSGILEETANNADQLLDVVNSFLTQMSDAKRLEIINTVAEKVNENYDDLHQFNNQNALLSLQRTKNESEIETVKAMYGLQ